MFELEFLGKPSGTNPLASKRCLSSEGVDIFERCIGK